MFFSVDKVRAFDTRLSSESKCSMAFLDSSGSQQCSFCSHPLSPPKGSGSRAAGVLNAQVLPQAFHTSHLQGPLKLCESSPATHEELAVLVLWYLHSLFASCMRDKNVTFFLFLS